MSTGTLRRTPLFDSHVKAGAKMVDFGGFEMPVKYAGETAEHTAVRTNVGVFDVSHMGEVWLTGIDAIAAAHLLFTNDIARIVDGQAMYTGLLTELGTFVDDLIVYRFSPTRLLVCVNAGNQDKDFVWMRAAVAGAKLDCAVENDSASWSQLAVQGPKARELVQSLTTDNVMSLEGFHFTEAHLKGDADCIIARTGYTGEDGFEVYVKNEHVTTLWDDVLAAGAVPCGLAARDTLRLEAGLALYGNDIDDEHTPLQAGLNFIVKLDGRPPFIGHDVLVREKQEGPKRLLRGLEMVDRGIARSGYPVQSMDGADIGVVTSGTQAPHVNKAIAMAYLAREHAAIGSEVNVVIRGKGVKARVCKLPFYKRS